MPSPSVTYTFANSTTADATQVNQNFTDLINGMTDGTKDFSINALTCAGSATLNGNVTLGNATGDDITFTGSLASTIPIKTNASFNFGSSTLGLASVYFGNSTFTSRVVPGSLGSSNTLTLPITTGTLSLYVAPTIQKFTSGSGTYTTPAGVKWIRLRMVGGGGGGSNGGTAGFGAGTVGNSSTFGTCTANGGGLGGAPLGTPGAGGSYTVGSGWTDIGSSAGNSGGGGPVNTTASQNPIGGAGGGSSLGGGGQPIAGTTAGSGATNSGGGGAGGAAAGVAGSYGGNGGGGGGTVLAINTAPGATFAYAVGATVSGAGAGTNGYASGSGAAGLIVVEEYYG